MSDKTFRDELAFEAFKAQVIQPDFILRLSEYEVDRATRSVAALSYRFADAMIEASVK